MYGIGVVVLVLVVVGLVFDVKLIQCVVVWLKNVQNDDGGWGEDLCSYWDLVWRGCGCSMVLQMVWVLLVLLVVGVDVEVIDRGVGWLVDNQCVDGCWDEEFYIGIGFFGDFYINYEMYWLVFLFSVLGWYLSAWSGAS